MWGFILITVAEILSAISYVSLRKLPTLHYMYAPFLKAIVLLVICLLYFLGDMMFGQGLIYYWSSRISTLELLILVGLSILDLFIQIMLCRSFQVEKAGLSASMNFVCVVWAFLGDMYLFGITYSSAEIIGGMLILLSVGAIFFTV